MAGELTPNALSRILRREQVDAPVIQILAYKKVPQAGEERFRILASDGVRTYQYLMAMNAKIIDMITHGKLEKFTVARLDNYLVNDISNKRVVIIEDLTVLRRGPDVGQKLGDPQAIQDSEIAQSDIDVPKGSLLRPADSSTGAYNPLPRSSNHPLAAPVSGAKPSPMPYHSTPANPPPRQNGSPYQASGQAKAIDKNKVVPINTLTPYVGKWTIKARVISKREKRTWSNAKGEGSLFSFEVTDESGEIRITAFRNECEKYYEMIEQNKVYYIANGQLKPSDPRYGIPGAEYEISLNSESLIEPCYDDDKEMPQIRYSFKEIANLQGLPENTTVDVIAIVKEVGNEESVTVKKTGTELAKRELTLVDKSAHEIRLTMWGNDAKTFDADTYLHSVVAIKGAKIKHFGGIALTGGTIAPNPQSPEAFTLKGWWKNHGQNASTTQLTGSGGPMGGSTPTRFAGELNQTNIINCPEEKTYSSIIGNVLNVVRVNLYKACKDCNRKVDDRGTGFYYCNKCAKEMSTYTPRIIATLQISDASGSIWANIFSDQLKTLVKKDSQELYDLAGGDQSQLQSILSREINFKENVFKVRSYIETYNEERRAKHTIASINPTNRQYNKLLISQINIMKPN